MTSNKAISTWELFCLDRTWQLTTQVEKAAWRQLQKFKLKHNAQKHAEMEGTLPRIWSQGDLFCAPRGRTPIWKLLPQHSFLPRDIATTIRSFVSQQQESSSREQDPSSAESSSDTGRGQNLTVDAVESGQNLNTMADSEHLAELDAEDILDRIVAQLQLEVDNESHRDIEIRPSEGDQEMVDLEVQHLPREFLSSDIL